MFHLYDRLRRLLDKFKTFEDAVNAAVERFGEVTTKPVGNPDDATTHEVHNTNGELVALVEEVPEETEAPTPVATRKPRRK